MLEDRVIIDTIEDDHNRTGVENMDVDTMTMDDAIIKFNSSDYDIVTNENSEELPTVDYDNMTVVGDTCGNSSLVEHMINATKHRGIVHGFSKSSIDSYVVNFDHNLTHR